MVVAARRRRDADENAVDEEGHRRFLQPQPGTADVRVTMSHITRTLKPGDGDAAQDHQDLFERIERAPFQVALLLQDQTVKAASLNSGFDEEARDAREPHGSPLRDAIAY